MKVWTAWVGAWLGVSLSACALQDHPKAPHTVNTFVHTTANAAFQVAPLTASTWTATAIDSKRPLSTDPNSRAAQLDAIEKHSGCKVTDSDYSGQGRQLDAQVDCGSRLRQ